MNPELQGKHGVYIYILNYDEFWWITECRTYAHPTHACRWPGEASHSGWWRRPFQSGLRQGCHSRPLLQDMKKKPSDQMWSVCFHKDHEIWEWEGTLNSIFSANQSQGNPAVQKGIWSCSHGIIIMLETFFQRSTFLRCKLWDENAPRKYS